MKTSGINDFNGGNFANNTGSGSVTGGGKLVLNSTSGHTLTLTGPNSYSGGTTIKAGTLDLANNVPGVGAGQCAGNRNRHRHERWHFLPAVTTHRTDWLYRICDGSNRGDR